VSKECERREMEVYFVVSEKTKKVSVLLLFLGDLIAG